MNEDINNLKFLELSEFDYTWDKEELLTTDGINKVRKNIMIRITAAKEIAKELIDEDNILLINILTWCYLKERNLFLFKDASKTLSDLRIIYNKLDFDTDINHEIILEILDEYDFINSKSSYLLFVLGEHHDYELGHEIIVFNPKTNKLAEVVDVDDIKVALSLFDCNEKVNVSYLFSYNIQKFGRQSENFYEQKAREIFSLINN